MSFDSLQSAFDALGRTIATTNADGVSATNTWNEWSELTKTAYPGGTSESFVYGDRGMTSATDRLGIATSYERDTLGRVTRTTDGEGHAVEVAYATNGTDQVESLTDANGNRTAWTYDEWGRKTGKAYADNSGETYAYDALGRMTNKLDPAGVATVFAYDANGNLTSLQRGNESAFSFGYDALDRRTNMLDTVGTTGWRYDELGRVTGETGPFGTGEVQVAYDANGRMTNVLWGAYEASYAYDALGRIAGITAPEGTYAFTYHANGIRRASVAYPNGVAETRTHDALARVTNLAFSTGTNEWLSIAYAYDAGDRRTNETWSTGREMAYGYDAAHQLTEVGASRPSDEARYCYDPAGNPIARAELGFEVTNAFNNLNQILSGSWTGSTITAVGAVNYPAGTVTVGGASGTIYADKTFDAAGVPVALGANTLTNVFTDIFGRSVTNTSHVTITNRAYVHDANGNLTGDGVFQYQYDAANQLTNVVRTADGARVLSARYDALGRRVEAIRGDGSVERYVYFPGSFLVLAVLDGSNAVKEIYTRGPDLSGSLDGAGGIGGLLAVTDSSSVVRYSHADIMGNVIALTDASGSVAATFRYTPFGQLSARTGSVLPRYLFSSKEFDRAVGLYYYGYRYYAPSFLRFICRDPVGEDGGNHLYCFVYNKPVNAWDYHGLRCCVLTWPGALGHSSLKCDNGTYISKFPTGGRGVSLGSSGSVINSHPTWHSEQDDIRRYGAPISQSCSDCLDEGAVSNWFMQKRNNNYQCVGANCADAVTDAVAAGLGNQTPPDVNHCPKPNCLQVIAGCYADVEDLADSSGITTPAQISDIMNQLNNNNCARYRCTISCPPPPTCP